MRALITGVTGFGGGHLAQILLEQGDEVFGIARRDRQDAPHLSPGLTYFKADLCDPILVNKLLNEIKPDAIYHLAGQAFVPTSWAAPWSTMENNIRPQLNILQAMVQQKSKARLLVVTSNQVYGYVNSEQMPVNEETAMNPTNPYGVSKVAQDLLGLQYYLSHKIDVVRVRPFNHIGVRQNPFFVTSSFAKQIAEAEAGLSEPILSVGNLQTSRDFTNVMDVMNAYILLIKHGDSGDVYNVGSGQAHTIQYMLDVLLSYSTIKITVQYDEARMRPSDVPIIYADNSKLRAKTGWKPRYRFEESLRQVLDYWREELKKPIS